MTLDLGILSCIMLTLRLANKLSFYVPKWMGVSYQWSCSTSESSRQKSA